MLKAAAGRRFDTVSLDTVSPYRAELGTGNRRCRHRRVGEFTTANPACELEVKEFVPQFDPQTSDAGSLTAAKAVVADRSVIGVVGPVFSHEVDLIGEQFTEAGLAFASPSATDPRLVDPDSGFFRGLPNERRLAESGANYLTERLGLSHICIVAQERSADRSARQVPQHHRQPRRADPV